MVKPDQVAFSATLGDYIGNLGWSVWANDPHDRTGILGVFEAGHSRGKAERMIESAFPFLSLDQSIQLIEMPSYDVFRRKKGGTKDQAIEDAWSTISTIVELVEGYDEIRLRRRWRMGSGLRRRHCCLGLRWRL